MKSITALIRKAINKYNGTGLILRIILGLIIGTVIALIWPSASWVGEFGTLFVNALKAVAPILVFVLVASALAQGCSARTLTGAGSYAP